MYLLIVFSHKYALAAVGSELARTNNTEMYVMYDIACFLAKKLEVDF